MERVLVFSDLCLVPDGFGLDLELRRGEFVALREVPERHESELMLAAATLRPPARGEVSVGGRRVEFRRRECLLELRSRIGYVGISSALVSDLTLRGNLLLSHRYFGREEEAQAAVDALARLLKLEPLLEMRPAHLPFELQRLAVFARELAKRPHLLILDRPGLGLSETAARLLCHALAEAKERGMAALLSAEPPFLALADRVLVLEEGQPAKELTVEAGGRSGAGALA
jgi:ABC-type multidrug transport system ATPase subunit